ncbi:MAG: hypothetical protein IIA81_04485 [Thaumarchaeota archaeon]|nr:hypothetical protein [Nitrososphaerota archaeon]
MTTIPGFLKKNLDVNNRHFLLIVLKFENGNFVSVSEGVEKLGSLVVSLSTGPTPVTTTVIPARTDSLFLKLTAERISTSTKGIAIVSAFIEKELNPETAKVIMSNITEMIQNV